MTHPLETLEGQQAELIVKLPNVVKQLTTMLSAEHNDELFRVVSARLTSGIDVFGHEMFTWNAGDLWCEAVEELADSILWLYAYLVVAENGPLPALANPRNAASPVCDSVLPCTDGCIYDTDHAGPCGLILPVYR